MIARLKGRLVALDENSALVEVGPISYQVLLPGYVVNTLADKIGTELILSTLEYYEGNPGGGNLVPRLVGFLSDREREFFELFTTVKGMGIRKALKALAVPVTTIAAAIEQADPKALSMLEGVGQRTAQQIIAELKGKVGSFAAGGLQVQAAVSRPFLPYQIEALEVLVAWGERRSEAQELIELASRRYPDVKTAEELVPLVYRLKQGIEV